MLHISKNDHYIIGGDAVNKYDTFFDDICRNYYNDIYKYLVFTLRDEDKAKDLVQDTFVVVYKNIEKVYNHENYGGYIFKTAQNLAKNYKKQLYKRLLNEVSMDEKIMEIEDYRSTIENSLNSEINEYEYITDIIDLLSEDKQKFYRMYYIEKKSMKEISEKEGIGYTALRMKYVRLRKEIKAIVKKLSENNFVT